jgi:type IX secretion system PorP/SprF family membrane protein
MFHLSDNFAKTMKKILLVFSGTFSLALAAQDFHYSLFTMAPLTYNSALTGNFTGDLRVVNNYRMQWQTISKPYSTFSISVDGRLPQLDKRKASPDFFALGVNVNVDKSGSTALKNDAANFTFSYNKSLDGLGATFFSFGVNAGLVQRSIGLSGASWDEQWTGLAYDSGLPTGESSTPDDSYFYFDFGSGAAFTTAPNDRFKMSAGVGVSHLNRPHIDFYGGSDKLYMKITAHYYALVALGANSNLWMQPQVLYVQQGPARMINVGAGFKYRLTERSHYTNYMSEKAFTIGGMYRLGDAVSAYTRLDIGPVGVGFNYDFNVSKLTTASKGMGALEFMVIYTGIFHDKNTRLKTPSFF